MSADAITYTTHTFTLRELRRAKIDLHFAQDEGFLDPPSKLISLEIDEPSERTARISGTLVGVLVEDGERYDRKVDWDVVQSEMWEVFDALILARTKNSPKKQSA